MAKTLFGKYYVTPMSSAISDALSLFPHYRHYQEARRHGLKLAYWPDASSRGDSGVVEDLDWEWVRALRRERIAELRIHDVIGGQRNLRLIFWIADRELPGDPVGLNNVPMKRIWVITVVNKKANNWSAPELASFRGRLKILQLRTYS